MNEQALDMSLIMEYFISFYHSLYNYVGMSHESVSLECPCLT